MMDAFVHYAHLQSKTCSNIVFSSASRRMRLRKLYEIGGAYRATILVEMLKQNRITIFSLEIIHKEKVPFSEIIAEPRQKRKTYEQIISKLTELVCLGVNE